MDVASTKRRYSPISVEFSRFLNEPGNPQVLAAALRTITNDDAHLLADIFESCVKGNRCRLTICPNCGTGHQKRSGRITLKDILGHLEAEALSMEFENILTGEVTQNANRATRRMSEISFVTINGPLCGSVDPSEIERTRKQFITKLGNTWKRYLNLTIWSGHIEVSLSDSPRLHIHLLIYHPYRGRDDLSDILKNSFTEPRAVSVSKWKTLDQITAKKAAEKIRKGEWELDDFNLAKSTRYTSKPFPRLPHRRNDKEEKIGTRHSLELLARYLVQTFHLRKDKFKGSRFRRGIQKPKGWKWVRSDLMKLDRSEVRHFQCLDIARGVKVTDKPDSRALTRKIKRHKWAKKLAEDCYHDLDLNTDESEIVAGDIWDCGSVIRLRYDDSFDDCENDSEKTWEEIGEWIERGADDTVGTDLAAVLLTT